MQHQSLSGYGLMFEDLLPPEFLASIDPTSRQRHFGHLPVLWAWLAQILEANNSCEKAVGLIQAWCRAQGLPVPASGNGAYCKARKRLSENFLAAVSERIVSALGARVGQEDLWHGFTLKAIDGSSVKLMDTSGNQEAYPQPSTQKKGCGFPVMSVSGLLNLSHGGWEAFQTGPLTTHDLVSGAKLLAHIGQGDLLLADRAYCSYGFIASVLSRGAHAVIRLHGQREAALDWRKGRRIGPYERLITWKRPAFSASPKKLSREEWEAMPEQLELRLVKLAYEDRTGRKRDLIVVTTLVDPERHDGIELFNLYARRWDIEVKLRDIKTTLGFEMMAVRTPAMARKTLMMIQIACNLLRTLMQRAARKEGGPAGTMSFMAAIHTVASMHESFRSFALQPVKRAAHRDFLIGLLAAKPIDHRPYRSEPRALKRRPKPFALLTAPRSEFIEIPHRNTYRKAA